MATNFIPYFDPFPGLVLYGPPSTGKTTTMNILRLLCNKPELMTPESITKAAFKATMNKAENGTLFIEEADKISERDFEGLLVTRYSKASGDLRKMVPDGKKWKIQQLGTFGATVLHRRILFKQPALLRRMIVVRTSRHKGEYVKIGPTHSLIRAYNQAVRSVPLLPETKNIWEVEPGIFDCYKPLVTLAAYIEDWEFLNRLVKEMETASKQLREEGTYLEAPIIAKALVALTYEYTQGEFTIERIRIEVNKIRDAVIKEFGHDDPVLKLTANQRNRIIRDDLGFEIKSSNGIYAVRFTIMQLVDKCKEYDVKDDLLDQWEKQILKMGKGQDSK